ncbi:hypothetical protein M5689_021217 [Euphorbia peplus]|nr:hypothetical protein M5689_021217 [Euphorbia peplus]
MESSSASAAEAIDILEMEIFSSETRMWRRYYSVIHLPLELPIMSTNPLFWNGIIHWELGGHLLMYFMKHSKFMLIKLPNYSQDWSLESLTYGQCLWVSQGHLHYCYSDFRGIHIWILVKVHKHNFCSLYENQDFVNLRWELSRSIRHDTLMTLNPEISPYKRKSRILMLEAVFCFSMRLS